MDDEILTQEEISRVILALGIGQTEYTEADIIEAVEWATLNRIAESCLNLVLSGNVGLKVENGKVFIILPDYHVKELARMFHG